jgi:hypothetical protein
MNAAESVSRSLSNNGKVCIGFYNVFFLAGLDNIYIF